MDNTIIYTKYKLYKNKYKKEKDLMGGSSQPPTKRRRSSRSTRSTSSGTVSGVVSLESDTSKVCQ